MDSFLYSETKDRVNKSDYKLARSSAAFSVATQNVFQDPVATQTERTSSSY